MAMKVFVTDGEQRPALAIVRSLARAGASVIVGAERPSSLASSSKYCARHVTYPSPFVDRAAFTRFLREFVARERIEVVLPVTDVTTHAVCADQEVLRSTTALAVPSLEAFEFASDKWRLAERAAACGVPIPRTAFVNGAGGLRGILDRIEYPAVVKPARSRIPGPNGWTAAGVDYACSPADLVRLYEQTPYLAAERSLVQQRVVGSGLGVFMLFDRGTPVAEFAHRRLREKPPSGGVSVLCESVPLDPSLRQQVIRLLAPLKWHGVAMVEFKQEAAGGDPVLIEVNGRFWGSLQLAIDAGVDFPRLAVDLALGRRPDAPAAFKVGVRSRWFAGDLDHLLLRLFKGANQLRLDPSAAPAWRVLADFLTCSARDEIARAADPGPFVHDCAQIARDLVGCAAGLVRPRNRRRGGTPLPPSAMCSRATAPGR